MAPLITAAEARQELLTGGISAIHEKSATDWATRALEAKRLFNETHDIRWAVAFTDLAHEAKEHAALGDSDAFLDAIRAKLRAAP